MSLQADIYQSRIRLMGQAIGPEFGYHHDVLAQPNNTMLIKLGGAVVGTQLETVADSVLTLTELGIYPIIVHGAGPQIDANLVAHGIDGEKIDGIRVTDQATLTVVTETLGTVNRSIVKCFESKGIKAQSLTDNIFEADFLDRGTYGFVGAVRDVDTESITDARLQHRVPVISCLGSNVEGRLNVNADTASAALAGKLMIHKFVTLSEVGGVLDRKGSIMPVLNVRSGIIEKLIANGTISEGMIPKINELAASVEQLSDDASAVITHPKSLIRELFTHAGEGTLIRKGDKIVHYASVQAANQYMIRQLIEYSFGGILSKDYFTKLSKSAEVFMTAQAYNGVAIVVPNPTHTESSPAYLDKLVVRPEFQGFGIGKELIDAAIARYPGGLYWRTKTSNHKQIDWYSKIADSRKTDGDWTVFTIGVSEKDQNDCIQRAVNVETSIAY